MADLVASTEATFKRWFRVQTGCAVVSCVFLVAVQPIHLAPLACVSLVGASFITAAAGYQTTRCSKGELVVMRVPPAPLRRVVVPEGCRPPGRGPRGRPTRRGRRRSTAGRSQVPDLRVPLHRALLHPHVRRHDPLLQGLHPPRLRRVRPRARRRRRSSFSRAGAEHADLEDHYVIATFVCIAYGCISIKATTSANNYGEAVCPIKSKKD